MHQYLQDTEFATQNLFRLATDEESQLKALTENLEGMERHLKIHQWDFQSSDLNDEFPVAYVMAAFGRVARAAQDVERLKHEVAVLQASIGSDQGQCKLSQGQCCRLRSKEFL